MTWIDLIAPHVVPFQLVLFRILGLVVAAPMISSLTIPFQTRILFAVLLAAAAYPMVPASHQLAPDLDLFELLPLIVSESMIGIVMGMFVLLPIVGMQMAGQIMGYQMGLGLAQAYNPELDIDADVPGQLLFFVIMGVFLAAGGLEAMFVALLRTFEHVPAGGFDFARPPLEAYVGVLGAATELAVRVATPVIGLLMLIQVAMGFIMKTMPQINVLSVGFPLKVIAGIALFALSIWTMQEAGGDEIVRVTDAVIRWADGLDGEARSGVARSLRSVEGGS